MELSSKFIENFNMWCSKCRDITTPDINLLLRSGGKLIEMNKKGKKIYIKKKNRGKFTSYCGGKVTSECIARGKRSSSPTIRKRATFAANARKWKHAKGGVIINGVKFVNKTHNAPSVLDTNQNMAKRSLRLIKKKK